MVNKKKREKMPKKIEFEKPGFESYRKTREDLTTMDKLHMALTELCFAINYCATISVWEYTFAPRCGYSSFKKMNLLLQGVSSSASGDQVLQSTGRHGDVQPGNL